VPSGARAAPNITGIEKRGKTFAKKEKRGRRRRIPSQRREEKEAPRRGGRCNSQPTFEVFRCNTYNIRLESNETLEIYI
jgi:hypothetical protein